MPRDRTVTAIRRPPSAVDPEQLERVAAKWEHRDEVAEVETAEHAIPSHAEASSKPGMVKRNGRLLADGTRKGARELRRVTAYLRPELAGWLADHCHVSGRQMSEVVAEALERYRSERDG